MPETSQTLHLRQVAFFVDQGNVSHRISVFDTTLRDGEQTPGVSFTLDEKITISHQLADIGVHVIEAGFPASSEDEFATIRKIASEGVGTSICGLARSVKSDVDRCIDAGVDIVHVFIPTSDIQRVHTIKKTQEEVLAITGDIIAYTRDHIDNVLFSAMDATRTEPSFLIAVNQAAVKAGATTVNIPDTVGIATPSSMKSLIQRIKPSIDATIDVHCHNDFGMATANTIAAVEGGASQVQVTVNGLGERAGNADLACTVMALTSIYGCDTGIVTERLVETSHLVSRFSGISVSPSYPVVGSFAFSHESGIHSQGVIEHSSTFEPGIMTPEMVGHRRRFKLGKHVGRHAVREMLELVHISPTDDQLDDIIRRIKNMAAKGKQVEENDLYAVAESVMGIGTSENQVVLDDIAIMTGSHVLPTATVRAHVGNVERVCCMTGAGPVDAAMKALIGIVPKKAELKDFSISAISGGSDAIGHVTIAIEDDKGRIFDAGASGEDVVLASVEAMIHALNMVYRYGKNTN